MIEQFDGYNRLEDCSLAEVKNRILDPKEYWGGGHGVAANTKIIKQADVVFMLYLFRNEYSHEVLRANWTYYEPRTEHGFSLSPCIYSLLSCEIGNEEWAYPFFVKSANIDLTGESKQFAGSIYIGGTHPAANGGAWMAAILGFAGLNVRGGKITVRPNLPKKWSRLAFNIIVGEEKYSIDITHKNQKIIKLY
ncbi:MAG: glycosyl hydrolase family 65 protein [Clostridia bacterium]